MPYPTSTVIDIIEILELGSGAAQITRVRSALDSIELNLGTDALTRVQQLITTIKSVDPMVVDPRDRYIVQLDVIKWALPENASFESQYEVLVKRLRSLLFGNDQGVVSGRYPGSTPLRRV